MCLFVLMVSLWLGFSNNLLKYAKIRSMEYTRGMYHDFMAKFGYTESVTHLRYRTTRSNP